MAEHSGKAYRPVIGITVGDINGIGPEIIVKTLSDPRIMDWCTPVVFGSTRVLSFYKKVADQDDFQYAQVKQEGKFIHGKVNVVACWEDMVNLDPGKITTEAGQAALKSLVKAVEYLKAGHIHGIVTAPINKENIQSESFNFPGHTEYFTKEFEASQSLMLMVSEKFRIGVATGHIPLKEVANSLSKELILEKLKIMDQSLRSDFGIQKSKIAVLGLNPHAGEGGLLGNEENETIKPVIIQFKKEGNLVFGPYPADGFFGSGMAQQYDGILAMYHDQGLVPFKALSFGSGVNYTAGLSIVRTSPDHGTAYDKAGKNGANPDSFRSALYLTIDIIKKRFNT